MFQLGKQCIRHRVGILPVVVKVAYDGIQRISRVALYHVEVGLAREMPRHAALIAKGADPAVAEIVLRLNRIVIGVRRLIV